MGKLIKFLKLAEESQSDSVEAQLFAAEEGRKESREHPAKRKDLKKIMEEFSTTELMQFFERVTLKVDLQVWLLQLLQVTVILWEI